MHIILRLTIIEPYDRKVLMNMEQLTTASQELLQHAAQIAVKNHNTVLQPIHLLAATLENEFCLTFFNMTDLPTHELKLLVKRELEILPQVTSGSSNISIDKNLEEFLEVIDPKLLSFSYIDVKFLDF